MSRFNWLILSWQKLNEVENGNSCFAPETWPYKTNLVKSLAGKAVGNIFVIDSYPKNPQKIQPQPLKRAKPFSLTFSDCVDMWRRRPQESEGEAVGVVGDLYDPGGKKDKSEPCWPLSVCLTDSPRCLTPWLWWRPAAAASVACRKPGWSWRRPLRTAWGTAGPRWWCRSSCPPAGPPSGGTDGQTGDRRLLFTGLQLFFLRVADLVHKLPALHQSDITNTKCSVYFRWNMIQGFSWQV